MKIDRSVPGWWRSGYALCRSCGHAFPPHRFSASVVCLSADCRAWLDTYSAALQSGAELPLEYGMRGPLMALESTISMPLVSDTGPARKRRKPSSRSVTQRISAIAHENELRREQREQRARRRGLDVIESDVLC